MAHRHDVARADEEVGLAELEIAVIEGGGVAGDRGVGGELRRAQDDEQGVAVAFELRPLVGAMGVLDREVVKVEGRLHVVEQSFARFVESQPDEDRRIRERRRDLVAGRGSRPARRRDRRRSR